MVYTLNFKVQHLANLSGFFFKIRVSFNEVTHVNQNDLHALLR